MHFPKDLHHNAVPVALPAAFASGDRATPAPHGSVRLYDTAFKRLFDVCLVVLCLPIVLPLVALLALMLLATGTMPLYRQARVGQNGHIFTMWKFRSMVPNADAALAQHLRANPAARAEWDRTQKLKNDPRITRIGQILRRSSMDELPQLWNVLKGEMSLVGPRPMLPEQQGLYPGTDYYKMLPGITGLWQISARNEAAFAERAFFDTRYHANLSFTTDLRTLLATVSVVTRATGH